MESDRSGQTPGARRGRPRSFDVDTAAEAALRTLWAKGYEASSVGDLVTATGLSMSSLYSAFGSKRGVLEAALTLYDRNRDDLLAPLERGNEGLEDLRRFLEALRQSVSEPGIPGCFMVNTSTEVAPHDSGIAARTSRYRDRVYAGITAALNRAVASGELPPGDVQDRARILQAGSYGALVVARAGDTAEARTIIDALMRMFATQG
ncbi:TetR/AcrR family transcriptional regulator [Actinomadura oligospora]|uniref:TetR/AcrR family transcriptional regulator n=1 Tax=Actinomadura oligospora TaxID=111804 RepID=UPI0004B3E536|nr:TetR/AcrR family transcriptional regulator [Actinomadura oligospora]